MADNNCTHCRGAEYVFIYWLEKLLCQNGIHMTDIPSEIFKKIPLEYLVYCHCNLGISRRKPSFTPNNLINCYECEGTTWRFAEEGEKQTGYRWKKVGSLAWDEIKTLPCEYFERCPCGDDEQSPKPPEKRKILHDISSLLKIPTLGFNSFLS